MLLMAHFFCSFLYYSMSKKPIFDLPYFNSTTFPLAVKAQLTQAEYDEEESKLLKYHQFVVKEYFTRTNTRGLLICHGMGQGKTRLAVSIANYIHTFDKARRIIVLSAKSLESNFRQELVSFTGKSDDYIDKNYRFVSLNSSNMYRQISNIDRDPDAVENDKRMGMFMEEVIRDNSLEGSMLIIDEAHNLFNSITNGAKNALALYDLIMEAKNIKLIFMSGTPIINDPFELVPCFNMLRGQIPVNRGIRDGLYGGDDDDDDNDNNGDDNGDDSDEESKEVEIDKSKDERYKKNTNHLRKNSRKNSRKNKPEQSDIEQDADGTVRKTRFASKKPAAQHTTILFDEDIDEFEAFFVDRENKTIKNKDKFTNRVFGLSSYYGDLYFPTDKNKPGFPKELDTIVERVPMSQTQFARYMSARIVEQDETKRGFRAQGARFSASTGGSSTYRVKSRQISNYCIPEYALGPVRGAKAREKFISKISTDDLINLDEFSPKMGKIIQNIEKHGGQPGIVYSQFVSGEGIAIFARVLQSLGYTLYGDKSGADESDFDIKHSKTKSAGDSAKTFAILSGSISPEERTALIQTYNRREQPIRLMLLSGAVAEGIDLKRTRHVHVMEPFWNYARINQVKTRAIRYLSHVDLPESEQNVQVYVYLSDYPVGYPKVKITEMTTDVDMYTKSIDNMVIINTFMQAIAESSIDCSVHHDKLDDSVKALVNCKLCSPSNAPLFHPLIRRDMEIPSTCHPLVQQQVDAEEIVLPGVSEKFYYTKNPNITIYNFNKKINGYSELPRSHPLYGDIMTAIVMAEY